MRILLAGVPFGCDNVGDEAILECAAGIFRKAAPDARITVSTRDETRTAARLGVETCGLLGFYDDVSPADTNAIIGAHDCFVWCGATGLSDYPQVTTELMRVAQELGKKSIVWGVGMNDALTPAFHRLNPGKRRTALTSLSRLTLGAVDAVAWEEQRRIRRSFGKIRRALNAADLVVVRDAPSRDEVLKCGVVSEVIVGADSALLMKPAKLSEMKITPGVRELLTSGRRKIGLCVSAQGPIEKEQELAAFLDEVITEMDASILAIPMNPLTDSALMARVAGRMHCRDHILVLTGEYTPSEITAISAEMDVIVSSRLHLLILAATASVPVVGIARGSKVANFLSHFGLAPSGSVEDCDFAVARQNVASMLENAQDFKSRAGKVLIEFEERLEAAERALADTLASTR